MVGPFQFRNLGSWHPEEWLLILGIFSRNAGKTQRWIRQDVWLQIGDRTNGNAEMPNTSRSTRWWKISFTYPILQWIVVAYTGIIMVYCIMYNLYHKYSGDFISLGYSSSRRINSTSTILDTPPIVPLRKWLIFIWSCPLVIWHSYWKWPSISSSKQKQYALMLIFRTPKSLFFFLLPCNVSIAILLRLMGYVFGY